MDYAFSRERSFFNAFNDSNPEFLFRDSVFKALTVNISVQRMDHNQGRHLNVPASSCRNMLIRIGAQQVFADNHSGT